MSMFRYKEFLVGQLKNNGGHAYKKKEKHLL